MKIRDIFKNQLSQLRRSDQELTYLLKTKPGYVEVRTVSHWRVQMLLQEYKYSKADQAGYVLPLFRER
jgi:hypothetical protein